MKIYKHFQHNYMINRKGQALVELAAFGAIFFLCLAMLLQYGMRANYQQNLQMQAFRKALKAAYYRSGPAATTGIAMVHDKGIPDPRDPWGFAERRPVSASGVATWDSNIQTLYEYGNQNDLPRTIIELNDTLALTDADLRNGAIDNINSSQGAFTTADYRSIGSPSSIMVVLENLSGGGYYQEVTIPISNIKVFNKHSPAEDPGEEFALYVLPAALDDGLLRRLTSADVDGDGELETIIEVEGSESCDDDGYCGALASCEYLDYQLGEIDTEYQTPLPWTEVGPDNQQGLLSDLTLTKSENNTMVKTETPTNLTTTTTVNSTQTATHYIRLRGDAPGRRPYHTTFSPAYGPGRVSRPEDVDAANWRPAK